MSLSVSVPNSQKEENGYCIPSTGTCLRLRFRLSDSNSSRHSHHLLGKIPSPKIVTKAFNEVKPNLIISVPLVIEKIYKNIIQPLINKKSMKWAFSIPLLDVQIYGQIRKKL
jgi:long-subunit acyl-CoA synthetase (AMP-forming)